jgi:hypothetical protein
LPAKEVRINESEQYHLFSHAFLPRQQKFDDKKMKETQQYFHLPAGIQKLILASMFSEYRLFLKTIQAEIIIEPVNIPTGGANSGLVPKSHNN